MKNIITNIKKYKYIYVLALPSTIYVLVFKIIPLYGLQIAFKDQKPPVDTNRDSGGLDCVFKNVSVCTLPYGYYRGKLKNFIRVSPRGVCSPQIQSSKVNSQSIFPP